MAAIWIILIFIAWAVIGVFVVEDVCGITPDDEDDGLDVLVNAILAAFWPLTLAAKWLLD